MIRALIITSMLSGIFLPQAFAEEVNNSSTNQGEEKEEKSFKDSLPPDLFNHKNKARQFLTLTVENDMFGRGSDQNYTNGVRITYFDTGLQSPVLADLMDKYLPNFDVNETTSVYYALGQNLYTPQDITRKQPDPDDRPYAAFLYGTAGLATVTDDHIDEIELTLGMIGPAALGEFAQEEVHHLVDSDDPKGWDHQLKNEPGLMLSMQRRWPDALHADNEWFYTRLTPHIGTTLGNVYTYANTGFTVQFLPSQYRWQSPPMRVRPAIPGNGFFAVPQDKFAWSLFAGVEGRAIARNIFLDGNTFESSPSVDKKHFVMDANVGAALTYGHKQISYTLNWRSKEFEGQDRADLFGVINFGYRF